MTDIVLNAKARAMTVGELLDRAARRPVRLVDPTGAAVGELFGELDGAAAFPGGFTAGRESPPLHGARHRRGGMTGEELRAMWRAMADARES